MINSPSELDAKHKIFPLVQTKKNEFISVMAAAQAAKKQRN